MNGSKHELYRLENSMPRGQIKVSVNFMDVVENAIKEKLRNKDLDIKYYY